MARASHGSVTQQDRWRVWAGWILSGLVVMFLAVDGGLKLVPIQPVLDAATQLGWPADATTWRVLGFTLIVSSLLYAIPRTSLLGAILITAYLGGAVATQVRVGNPLFSHVLFGVYLGLMCWGSLWLREPRLRDLLLPRT